jgi:hypothetical protein
MRLLAQRDDGEKVRVVHMRVHAEQPLEDVLHARYKVFRELRACTHTRGVCVCVRRATFSPSERTYLRREHSLVVELRLHPRHQILDVIRCRTLDGFLDVRAVSPMVLVSE